MTTFELIKTHSKEELITIISEATKKAFSEEEEVVSSLSPKAQHIQDFLSSEPFGCNTSDVAKLMSLVLEEPIVVKQKRNPSYKQIAWALYNDDEDLHLQNENIRNDDNKIVYNLYLNSENDLILTTSHDVLSRNSLKQPTLQQIETFVEEVCKIFKP